MLIPTYGSVYKAFLIDENMKKYNVIVDPRNKQVILKEVFLIGLTIMNMDSVTTDFNSIILNRIYYFCFLSLTIFISCHLCTLTNIKIIESIDKFLLNM